MRRIFGLAVLSAAFLIPAAASQASFISSCQPGGSNPYCESTSLSYSAAGGETNNVTINRSGDNIVLVDTGAVISQSSNNSDCTISGDGHTATCPHPAAQTLGMFINLNDLNDTIVDNVNSTSSKVTVFAQVFGGDGNDNMTGADDVFGRDSIIGGLGDDTGNGRSGNDFLSDDGNGGFCGECRQFHQSGTVQQAGGTNSYSGGAGDDSLFGGPGVDTLKGEAGDDYLEGESFTTGFANGHRVVFDGKANDNLDGGDGFDTVAYDLPPKFDANDVFVPAAPGDAGATVTLPEPGKTSNGGLTGEADVLTAIEDVNGTEGADSLVGSSVSNIVSGFGGNDAINGASGPDILMGGGDDDNINAADGIADRVECGGQAGDKATIDQLDAVSGCPAAGSGTTITNVTPPNSAPPKDTTPPVCTFKAPKSIKAKTLKKSGYKLEIQKCTDPTPLRAMATETAKVGKFAISSTAGEVILAETRKTFTGSAKLTLKTAKKLQKAIKKGRKLRILIQVTDTSGNTTAKRVVVKVK